MRVLLILPGCRVLAANKVFNLLLKLCPTHIWGREGMEHLLLLGGARTMRENLVCTLLGLCILFGSWERLVQMLKLPAGAQHMPSNIVEEQLLVPAVKARIGSWHFGCLLELRGAQQLSWEAAFRLVAFCCSYHAQSGWIERLLMLGRWVSF